jgi:Xaa-Pro aminopeptidase
MKPNSIAVFYSNDLQPRNGDQFYPFRQNSDLLYLSGLDQEETTLAIFPDCPREDLKEVAFIKRTDKLTRTWEGAKYTIEEARKISGIKRIYWLSDMEKILHELILQAQRIYINGNENERFHSPVPSRDRRNAVVLRERYPFHKYHRSQPILKRLRMIKSSEEVELISNAAKISGGAFLHLIGLIRPDLFEYEIEAEIRRHFISKGATGMAFETIVASGPNACVLHYTKNNRKCKDGDLVLMDFGAEYANYASDLSRTVPVNGKFNKRQRAVYDSVVAIYHKAVEMMVPGNTLEELNRGVAKVAEEELIKLALLKSEKVEKQDPENPLYKKFFLHSISHHLGLDVHDLSDRFAPLQSGMILTCEPGIYIPEEEIGIRVENDILITDHGPVNLMGTIPLDADEIESLMHERVLT